MASVVELSQDYDRTDVPHIVRCAVQLGVLEAAFVLACSLVMRFTSGAVETAVLAVVLVIGLALVSGLPGLWTRARTIEGIAGAAGIGLAATGVFLLVDVALLQPIGTYTNRWREIGGGSNWWYHPIWWMVSTYLAWMGGWTLANQTARSGAPNGGALVGGTMVIAAIIMVIAKLGGMPGAAFGVGTFAVAILPAVALMTIITGLGARRG